MPADYTGHHGPLMPRRLALPARLRIIAALIIRETAARFGRSVGGYLWAIAEPAGGILLLSLAFSFISRTAPMGDSFMMFYASGLVPFLMYNNVAQSVMMSLRTNRGLLTYPIVTALDTILARAILETLTYILIGIILVLAIAAYDQVYLHIDLARILLAVTMAFALGLGVGTMNCVLVGFFPTWQNIWGMINRPLFIASGVLFNFNSLSEDLLYILWFNPIAHVIVEMREGIYNIDTPGFVSLPYVFGLGLGLFAFGAFLLERNESYLKQQ